MITFLNMVIGATMAVFTSTAICFLLSVLDADKTMCGAYCALAAILIIPSAVIGSVIGYVLS